MWRTFFNIRTDTFFLLVDSGWVMHVAGGESILTLKASTGA
jgi:hypothetical protein